jgi:hypothetical protein
MEIAGPLKFAVLQQPDVSRYELHLTFTQEFRSLDLSRQAAAFRDYVRTLGATIHSLSAADHNRAGMLIAQQLAEQLLPHIEAGEMALEDVLVVEIGPANPFAELLSRVNE